MHRASASPRHHRPDRVRPDHTVVHVLMTLLLRRGELLVQPPCRSESQAWKSLCTVVSFASQHYSFRLRWRNRLMSGWNSLESLFMRQMIRTPRGSAAA